MSLLDSTNVWLALSVVFGSIVLYILYDYWQSLKRRYSFLNMAPSSTKADSYFVPAAPHEYRVEELAKFDGENGNAILIALKGIVYDVTSHPTGRSFYGKGAGYGVFAGKDASRALATMDFEDIGKGTDGLSEDELNTLAGWVAKYEEKYNVVGSLKS